MIRNLEVSRFDSWHRKRHRFDGVVQDPERSRKLDQLHVADVLWEKSEALVKPGRPIGRKRKEVGRVFGDFERADDAVALCAGTIQKFLIETFKNIVLF